MTHSILKPRLVLTAVNSVKILLSIAILFLLSGCANHLFYHPDHFLYYPPEQNGYAATDVWFEAGDGTKLHGWFFRTSAKKIKGTIVQFHGNAQNITSHYASLVWLTKHGYNLFSFDYRGYGKSLGEPSPEGTYKDGMAALDQAWHLHQKFQGKRFVVFGQSLGGVIALRSFADFTHQSQTSLIVADSTFLSYDAMAGQWLRRFWITWPFSWLGPLLVSDKYSAAPVLPKLNTRLLVIHDLKDPVVDYRNGKEIYEQARSKKDLWTLNQARHIAVFAVDSPQNRERFLHLLDE